MTTGLSRGAWGFLGVAALLACAAATLAPLATYALTLATFGLVHVLTELRYVDGRFAPRLPRSLTTAWLGILALIVLLRLVPMTTGAVLPHAATGELMLVTALAIGALIPLRHAPWPRRLIAVLITCLLGYGALAAPLATLALLAVLHNLTPIGFLAERFDHSGRARWLVGATLLFGAVPLLIASGTAQAVMESLGAASSTTGPLGTGEAREHFGAFLPAAWQQRVDALALFAAAAYLQCMHYAVVIGILPRLGAPGPASRRVYVRWPARRIWIPLLAVVAVGGFLAHAWSFPDARAVYGLFALVHAWIEVPVLLAALAPLPEAA